MFPWSIPPPVDPALAGAPGAPTDDIPPWLLEAAANQANGPQPLDPYAAPPAPPGPPPGPPPPVSSELAGAPGAPQAPPEPPAPRAGPPAQPNRPPWNADVVVGAAPVVPEGPPGARTPAEQQQRQQNPTRPTGSLAEEQDSMGRTGDLAARQAQVQAEGLAKQAAFEQAQIHDAQLAEMNRRRDLAQREQQLEAERVAFANKKVDPNQWWSSRSDAQKGVAYIGAFLGGMLSTTNGGKNDFTDFMDSQVKLNLDAQKTNLATRKAALDQGESMYGKLLQRYGDERVADQMFMAMNYEAMGHQTAAQAAQFNSPMVKENSRMLQIQAAKQAAIATREAAKAQQELELKKQQVQIQRIEAGTGRMNATTSRNNEQWQEHKDVADLAYKYEALGLTHEEAMAKARAEGAGKGIEAEKWDAEKKARTLYMPNGKPLLDKTGAPVLMGNAEIADKQRQQLDNTWQLRNELTQYLDLVEKAGREFEGLPGLSKNDALAKAEQLYADMMFKVKNSQGTGALDKGMVEVFNGYVAPPRTWLGQSNPTASARQGLESWKGNTNNRYRMQYGYEGNFVDDWDRQVSPVDPKAPVTSDWMQDRHKKERQITEDSYDVTYPGPVGPPKPIGTPGALGSENPTSKNPEELQRSRGPTREETEAGDRIGFVEKYMAEQPVTLRTGHGDVKVPRNSVTQDNAQAAGDGSFISLHDKPKQLPPGVKPIAWQDAQNRDLDHAEDMWAQQKKTVGSK